MAEQHPEVFDSAAQKTHEWLGAIAEASHLSKAFGPPLNLSSSLVMFWENLQSQRFPSLSLWRLAWPP